MDPISPWGRPAEEDRCRRFVHGLCEPDVDIQAVDAQVQVEIHDVGVYDPTTGEVRSGSTDDIACWFIDSNYNGGNFFVRHAYLPGPATHTHRCVARSAPTSMRTRGRRSTRP
jgi:hypothetical protein